jgi:nucleotide-binding universal stress UspA family protein
MQIPQRPLPDQLSVHKILVPIVFADTSRHIIQQAAWLARRFSAEIVLLHVVTPFHYPASFPESGHEVTARDLESQVIQRAQQDLERTPQPELDGVAVTRVLLRGDPAREIVKSAVDRNVDLIMMSTRGQPAFYRFLVGSVTAKVLHESDCPVWTGAHLEDPVVGEFAVRNVLCSVDLSHHSYRTAALAAQLATSIGAALTLVYITESVGIYGPGGLSVDPTWKETIVGFATKEMERLQESIGTKAEVIVDSGNVLQLLNQVAERTRADLLVIGHSPVHGHLGDNGNGYAIIRESRIPVLSV